jgi:hypothetical protein
VTGGLIYRFKDKEDNRRQKICLWAGLAVIVLMGTFPPVGKGIAFFFKVKSQEIKYATLAVQWCMVGAITGSLIYAFKDKKDE